MPQFTYKAKKGPKDLVEGTLEASSMEEAVDKLDAMGLFPTHVDELKAPAQGGAQPAAAMPVKLPSKSIFSRVKASEVTVFSRQLASLVRAGVPMLRALWIIQEQTPNPRFKALLGHVQQEVSNGQPLSAVLGEYPKLFPPIYLAMVRTGEDSGTLQEVLFRISEYRQRQEEILSRVRAALAYPILMAVTGIGTVVFMLTFVIPKLSKLFSTMGADLPLPTRILMTVSGLFRTPWFWWAAGLALVIAALLVRTRMAQLKALWSRVSLELPFIRDFVLKVELARFSRTLELLIKSGVSILRALQITAPVLDNTVLREKLVKIHEKVTGGDSLGKSLKDAKVFPLFMTNLVSVGEESGRLEESLSEIAQFYERETDEVIKIMTSLLEPLMILAMGCVVGFIVIAMLLPMFELNMMVK